MQTPKSQHRSPYSRKRKVPFRYSDAYHRLRAAMLSGKREAIQAATAAFNRHVKVTHGWDPSETAHRRLRT